MTLQKIAIIATTMSLMSGCAFVKSLQKSETSNYKGTPPPAAEQVSQPQKREVINQNNTSNRGPNSRKRSETESAREVAPKKNDSTARATAEKVEKELPVIKFSDVESAHVRIPLNVNNPFPESNELIVALPALQEDFCYPYMGKKISEYGRRGRSNHTGVDIKAIPKDTIRAAFSGVVRMSKPYSGYGNIIVLRHYNGIETVYAHQTKNLVQVNDVVKSGDPIGLAGRTGTATTEHLHFELRVASEVVNPNLLIDTENQTLRNDTLYFYKNGGSILAYNRPTNIREVNLAKVGNSASSSAGINESSISGGSGSSEAKYHTIKQGDTLYKLARTYSTTVKNICKLNGISETKILQLKEKLRVK